MIANRYHRLISTSQLYFDRSFFSGVLNRIPDHILYCSAQKLFIAENVTGVGSLELHRPVAISRFKLCVVNHVPY